MKEWYDVTDSDIETIMNATEWCPADNGYKVTSFEQVEDGSKNLSTAKKIFGDKYDAFIAINSDEHKREKLRADVLTSYVKKHNLKVSMYQDFGWPAKKLGI